MPVSTKVIQLDLDKPVGDHAISEETLLPATRFLGRYTVQLSAPPDIKSEQEFYRKHKAGELTEYAPAIERIDLKDVYAGGGGTLFSRSAWGSALRSPFSRNATRKVLLRQERAPDFRKPLREVEKAISFLGDGPLSNDRLITDILPKLWLLRQSEDSDDASLKLILPPGAPAIVHHMLEIVGFDSDRIIKASLDEDLVFIRHAIHFGSLCRGQIVHPAYGKIPDWVFSHIPDTSGTASAGSRRVYLAPPTSADGKNLSNCDNEAEVYDILQQEFGFECVRFGGPDLGRQLRNLYNAQLVIGERAPRLLMSVFAAPQTKILSIRSRRDHTLLQSGLCRARQQPFWNIFGGTPETASYKETTRFRINCYEFRKRVESLLKDDST